ncbi:MAG: carbohydrate ABC transporter permease [Deinococcota bacterium]
MDVVAYALLLVFMAFLLFPLYFMVVTMLKPEAEITSLIAPLGVRSPTLDNIRALFTDTPFLRWSLNSTIVAVSTTVISTSIAILAAYALVRYKFRGAQTISMAIFITYLVPSTLLFIPMTVVVRELGLFDNIFGLIVVYPTMAAPLATWLLTGFFRTIPRELEAAARIDGASYWQAFYMVTLPLARSGIISTGIFTFTVSWNEYLYALALLPSSSSQTLPVGVPNAFAFGDAFFWGPLMTAAVLGSVPIVLVYSLSMKAFVSGMTAGAVKG